MDFRLILSIILWIALLAISLSPAVRKDNLKLSKSRIHVGLFLLLFAIALPAWRLRSLFYNGEINVDESQFIAQVLRYQIDPIPWRSVDGGSSGPLNTWVLMWAPLLGFKIDYFAARVTSLLCIWATVAGLVFTLVELTGKRIALLLAMPAITFYLTSLNLDYVFYSSELLPSAIISWIFFFATKQAKAPSQLIAFLIGVLCGSLPFCKIQAGPSALYLWAIVAGGSLLLHKWSAISLRLLLFQFGGGFFVPLLILGPVFLSGAWPDFMDLYIRTALQYKSSAAGGSAPNINHFFLLLKGVPELFAFEIVLIGIAVGLAALFFINPRKRALNTYLVVAAIIGFALVITHSIYRTGFLFPHYTLFLIVPFTLSVASLTLDQSDVPEPFGIAGCAGIVALIFAVQGGSAIREFKKAPQFLGDWGSGIHPIGEILKKLSKPGDTMVVWGYAPKYHVFSGIPPATRNSTTTALLAINPEPSQFSKTYLERFLSDLTKYKPALFIDSPDEFWFPDPSIPRGTIARHNIQRQVANLVAADYQLAGQVNMPPGKVPALIYTRKPTD